MIQDFIDVANVFEIFVLVQALIFLGLICRRSLP